MFNKLKALLGLAHREDATSDEIAPSLPAVEAELVAARAAQAQAEAAYKAALLSPDDALRRELRAARLDAVDRIDQAGALLEKLQERLEEARAREAEAERVARYQAAQAEADEARGALVEHYDHMASDLVRLLEIVARAELKVCEVNADLPRGAAPLAPVEAAVRDVLTEADEVLSEVIVHRWVEVGCNLPNDIRDENVRKTSPGRGVIRKPGVSFENLRQVERRTFTERTIRRGKGASPRAPLATQVALPGLRADDLAFWAPRDNFVAPLAVIHEAEGRRLRQPNEPLLNDGFVVIELIPQPGVLPVERVNEVPLAQDSAGALEAAE